MPELCQNCVSSVPVPDPKFFPVPVGAGPVHSKASALLAPCDQLDEYKLNVKFIQLLGLCHFHDVLLVHHVMRKLLHGKSTCTMSQADGQIVNPSPRRG
jgi:hypothetical protein